MAPPARAPAAAPAAVAEQSVPTPATESSAAAQSSSSSTPSPAAGAPDREPEVEMTNPVPDRKRGHSAVDPSAPAAAEDDRGPMVIEDKRQRLQEEIAMVAADCQDETPIEWDEDEERVWKHRLKHIEDLKSNQTCERVPRQSVSQRVLSHRWVQKPHRSRYTVRGFEQELTGAENLCAPTPL